MEIFLEENFCNKYIGIFLQKAYIPQYWNISPAKSIFPTNFKVKVGAILRNEKSHFSSSKIC